jgi:hypothetical protein
VLTINAPLRNCGQQSVSTTPQRGVSEMGELTDATRLQLNPADPSPSELVIASSHTIDTISESDLHGNCFFNSHRRPLTPRRGVHEKQPAVFMKPQTKGSG